MSIVFKVEDGPLIGEINGMRRSRTVNVNDS